MSKTIEHNGNIYEVGRVYFFYDDGEGKGVCDYLSEINPNWDYPFKAESACWINCEEFDVRRVQLGTITKASDK